MQIQLDRGDSKARGKTEAEKSAVEGWGIVEDNGETQLNLPYFYSSLIFT